MDGSLFAKHAVFQTWIWFHHSTSYSRIISSTSSSLSLSHIQRSCPGSTLLRHHVCRGPVLRVQRATVYRWVVLLMRATPGLSTVWALVYRGCLCPDPPVCLSLPRQDGMGDRAPTLLLLLLTVLQVVLVLRLYCVRVRPSLHVQSQSPLLVEYTCRGHRSTCVAPYRIVHLQFVLVHTHSHSPCSRTLSH